MATLKETKNPRIRPWQSSHRGLLPGCTLPINHGNYSAHEENVHHHNHSYRRSSRMILNSRSKWRRSNSSNPQSLGCQKSRFSWRQRFHLVIIYGVTILLSVSALDALQVDSKGDVSDTTHLSEQQRYEKMTAPKSTTRIYRLRPRIPRVSESTSGTEIGTATGEGKNPNRLEGISSEQNVQITSTLQNPTSGKSWTQIGNSSDTSIESEEYTATSSVERRLSNLPGTFSNDLPQNSPHQHPSAFSNDFSQDGPNHHPSAFSNDRPTWEPTWFPTASELPPAPQPTAFPTRRIYTLPPFTPRPTESPTRLPPTRFPTRLPTRRPSATPTRFPTRRPSSQPTKQPTRNPTQAPSPLPTDAPSSSPTKEVQEPGGGGGDPPEPGGPPGTPISEPGGGNEPNMPSSSPTAAPTSPPSEVPTIADNEPGGNEPGGGGEPGGNEPGGGGNEPGGSEPEGGGNEPGGNEPGGGGNEPGGVDIPTPAPIAIEIPSDASNEPEEPGTGDNNLQPAPIGGVNEPGEPANVLSELGDSNNEPHSLSIAALHAAHAHGFAPSGWDGDNLAQSVEMHDLIPASEVGKVYSPGSPEWSKDRISIAEVPTFTLRFAFTSERIKQQPLFEDTGVLEELTAEYMVNYTKSILGSNLLAIDGLILQDVEVVGEVTKQSRKLSQSTIFAPFESLTSQLEVDPLHHQIFAFTFRSKFVFMHWTKIAWALDLPGLAENLVKASLSGTEKKNYLATLHGVPLINNKDVKGEDFFFWSAIDVMLVAPPETAEEEGVDGMPTFIKPKFPILSVVAFLCLGFAIVLCLVRWRIEQKKQSWLNRDGKLNGGEDEITVIFDNSKEESDDEKGVKFKTIYGADDEVTVVFDGSSDECEKEDSSVEQPEPIRLQENLKWALDYLIYAQKDDNNEAEPLNRSDKIDRSSGMEAYESFRTRRGEMEVTEHTSNLTHNSKRNTAQYRIK